MRALAADPAKRWMEKFVLAYTPIWIGVVVAVMLTRAFERWGDWQHLAFGIGLALPLWIVPAIKRNAHALRFNVFIGAFSFLQCYFGSDLFFDVLQMEYHFNTRIIWHRTPLFLYFLTIAYFSTYYVVQSIVWRALITRFPSLPLGARLFARAVLGYATAAAETAGMANPLLAGYFLYRDRSFALLVGSLCYGTLFFVSFPYVYRLDEDPSAPKPTLRAVAWDCFAVNTIVLVCYAGWTLILSK